MTTNKQHFWIDREHERIATEITGEAGPAGGPRKPAVITNLSAGGLKFACDREAFNLMLPEDQRIPGQVSDVEIEIQFELRTPDRENPFAIRTRVRIIHTERLAQDSYTLGVQFIALSNTDRDDLQSYLKAEAARRGLL